jgi:hypothetical protein
MDNKFDPSKILVKKPTIFPLRINPAPTKLIELKKYFGEVLAQKFAGAGSANFASINLVGAGLIRKGKIVGFFTKILLGSNLLSIFFPSYIFFHNCFSADKPNLANPSID